VSVMGLTRCYKTTVFYIYYSYKTHVLCMKYSQSEVPYLNPDCL